MRIQTADLKRTVDVGGSDIWISVYSTVEKRLKSIKGKIPDAAKFLREVSCEPKAALETARQFNLIRDELSQYPPSKAVYDLNDPKRAAPWEGNLSPVITSCANLYTTADGKDLLYEVVSILVYAYYAGVSVTAE